LFLGLRKRRVSRERLLLAGDAAGLIEFFSGNGIPQAYGSGMLAADVAIQAGLKGNFSAEYLREYDRLLHQKYMSGRFLARFFFKFLHWPVAGRLLLRFLSFLASKPHSNQLLLDLLYHPKPLLQFLNPIFWKKLILRGKSSADKNTMALPLHSDASAGQLVA
jgi:flavin-dependent dehydrogenase